MSNCDFHEIVNSLLVIMNVQPPRGVGLDSMADVSLFRAPIFKFCMFCGEMLEYLFLSVGAEM
jgi:hypothetical protein